MDQRVLEALGLQLGATAADAVVAINALRAATDTAMNAARMPDPAQFVPRADYQLALNRINGFEAAEQTRREAEIVAAVDAAVVAGKVSPASRELHLAACRADGMLELFIATMEASPPIVGAVSTTPAPAAAAAPALTAEELAVCRMFGTTPTAFAAAKTQQQER